MADQMGQEQGEEIKKVAPEEEGKETLDAAESGQGLGEEGGDAPSADAAEVAEVVETDPLAEVAAERDDWKDKAMRTAADLENARRRWNKEREDLRKYGVEDLMRDILPALDSFDQALVAIPDSEDTKAVREGVELVKRQLLDSLGKHGLEALAAEGKAFDPNFHQGIQRIEDAEVETETVAQEFQKGYTLHGRLVRAAMVSVKVPGASKGDEA